MKKLILLGLLTLAACSPCRNDDCPVDASLLFQIEDQSGTNLLQLPRQKYSKDSISIALKRGDIYVLSPLQMSNSSIQVALTANVSEVVINYGTTESDTLLISNPARSTLDDCCDPFLQDYSLSGAGLSCESCSSRTHVIIK